MGRRMPIRRVMLLIDCRGRTAHLHVLQWRSGEAEITNPLPGPRWSATFADGGGSPCAFHALHRVGVDKGLRRARVQEGDTAELYVNGAAVDRNFGSDCKAVHRPTTPETTQPLLGETGRVLAGVGG